MLIHADERLPVARLLKFLELGERVAQACATSQAALAADPGARRFFRSQARQEGIHAGIFRAASAWLAPRHLGATPFFRPLDRYRRAIEQAVHRGDLAETLVAQQVVMEGLGEVILGRMERGLVKRAARFTRLRRILLQQEAAHHAFGLRAVERVVASGDASAERLKGRGLEYVEMAGALIMTTQELFSEIDEDAAEFADEFRRTLPRWLTS